MFWDIFAIFPDVFRMFLCFRLAMLTAAVMLSRGVPVHLFSVFVPTPYVVRKQEHILSSGLVPDVVFTASAAVFQY